MWNCSLHNSRVNMCDSVQLSSTYTFCILETKKFLSHDFHNGKPSDLKISGE